MGWIGAAGSIGRIVFPSISGIAGHNTSFIISAVSAFLCSAILILYQWKFKMLQNVSAYKTTSV
jgi:hypothetical protein